MDFKSLLSKLDSMEAPAKGVAAPELPKSVQLNEDAQLRVLSGRTTYVAEAKKKAEEDVKEADDKKKKMAKKEKEKEVNEARATDKKKGAVTKSEKAQYFAKTTSKDGKTTKGSTHEAGEGETEGDVRARVERDAKSKGETVDSFRKKELDESIKGDLEEGWDEMVKEIKAKFPTVADAEAAAAGTAGMKAGEKKKSSTGGEITKTDKGLSHAAGKNYSGKSAPVKEGNKGDGNLANNAKPYDKVTKRDVIQGAQGKDEEGGKKGEDNTGEASGKKGMSAKQEKFFGKKKAVKESVEGTLTFAKALQIIKESNGTAQIDPLDDQLWAWARRVAATKFNESVKADVYAATTYERMGGTWGIAQINE